jgi:hypothetical protein
MPTCYHDNMLSKFLHQENFTLENAVYLRHGVIEKKSMKSETNADHRPSDCC